MLRIGVLMLLCVLAPVAWAFDPVVQEFAEPYEVHVVEVDATQQREYLGVLNDYPEMYEITSQEPFTLRAEVIQLAGEELVPLALIAVRQNEFNGGVSEVARVNQPAEEWRTINDPVLALTLRTSNVIEVPVEAGTYRVEVSSPENSGAYMLRLGSEPVAGGYFKTLADIRTVQAHFGVGWLSFLRSTYVFYPLGSLIVLGGIYFTVQRLRSRTKPEPGSESAIE
jgi:hypothetical protein